MTRALTSANQRTHTLFGIVKFALRILWRSVVTSEFIYYIKGILNAEQWYGQDTICPIMLALIRKQTQDTKHITQGSDELKAYRKSTARVLCTLMEL